MHMGIPICTRGLIGKTGKSPYAYGNPHLHTGMSPLLYPHMHMAIPACILKSPYAYRDCSRMMGFPVCIWWSLYAHGDESAVRSPYAYGNHCMKMGIPICIRGFLQNWGFHCMHMAIPICIRGQAACSIPVCIWKSPYAYGDFVNANIRIGIEITATSPFPICIWWFACFQYAYGQQQLAILICIRWFAYVPYAYGDSPVTNPFANGFCLHMRICGSST
jgi:hypothetical protein